MRESIKEKKEIETDERHESHVARIITSHSSHFLADVESAKFVKLVTNRIFRLKLEKSLTLK